MTSLQAVFYRAKEKAGIRKPATVHTLRHNFATHLLDKGTDLRHNQELLDHKSSKTAKIYTHVSQKKLPLIISPFDDFDIGKLDNFTHMKVKINIQVAYSPPNWHAIRSIHELRVYAIFMNKHLA